MKKATLDLTDCKYLYDLHERIQKSLNLPDYYGKNLDAFEDCISCESEVNFVTIVGLSTVSNDLNPTIKKIVEILERNKQEWINTDSPFDYEIIS